MKRSTKSPRMMRLLHLKKFVCILMFIFVIAFVGWKMHRRNTEFWNSVNDAARQQLLVRVRELLSSESLRSSEEEEEVQRVSDLNARLETIRRQLLENSSYVEVTPRTGTLLYEVDPEYFEKIKNFSCVTTLSLDWKAEDANSSRLLLIEKYYPWTASQPLCQWIATGEINYRYGYIYNYSCNSDIEVGSVATDIEPIYMNSRAPSTYDTSPFQPSHRYQMPESYPALQVFHMAVVSGMGEPFCNRLQVKPDDCLDQPSPRPDPKTVLSLPFYAEVFVISQRWGEGYFHRMIEDIPRLALFLDFLRRHPSIKILAYDRSNKLLEILATLGLSSERVVSGWVRARVAYVPRSTSCGTPNMIELQFFQRHNAFVFENLLKKEHHVRNKLLLVKRSGIRKFADQDAVERLLKETAFRYGLEFVVFPDDPSPSLNDTMVMFALASVVVAPHGAGLANLVYSRPGTLVIEGVCHKPLTNFCYQRTAYALGMRWHGIPSLRGCEGVVDVSGDAIDEVLKAHLRAYTLLTQERF